MNLFRQNADILKILKFKLLATYVFLILQYLAEISRFWINATEPVANDLRTYIAELTDQPLPEPETMNDYRYSYDATPAMTVFGTINLQFSRTADVQIAMFNKDGVIVRELFRFENLTPGPHRLKYTFDNSVYTDDEYTVKVIRNGDVLLKRVIRMG